MAPLQAVIAILFANSAWAIELQETDGAYAVDRLWAHLLKQRATSAVLDCHFRCSLHQAQLIEVYV